MSPYDCLSDRPVAGSYSGLCGHGEALLVTTYMKEEITMSNEALNTAKALPVTARRGWLGD